MTQKTKGNQALQVRPLETTARKKGKKHNGGGKKKRRKGGFKKVLLPGKTGDGQGSRERESSSENTGNSTRGRKKKGWGSTGGGEGYGLIKKTSTRGGEKKKSNRSRKFARKKPGPERNQPKTAGSPKRKKTCATSREEESTGKKTFGA